MIRTRPDSPREAVSPCSLSLLRLCTCRTVHPPLERRRSIGHLHGNNRGWSKQKFPHANVSLTGWCTRTGGVRTNLPSIAFFSVQTNYEPVGGCILYLDVPQRHFYGGEPTHKTYLPGGRLFSGRNGRDYHHKTTEPDTTKYVLLDRLVLPLSFVSFTRKSSRFWDSVQETMGTLKNLSRAGQFYSKLTQIFSLTAETCTPEKIPF